MINHALAGLQTVGSAAVRRAMESQTSLLVYDSNGISEELVTLRQHLVTAFGNRAGLGVLFSVKANSHPDLLRWFAGRNIGAAVASMPEYHLAKAAGMHPIYATAPGFKADDLSALSAAGVALDIDNIAQLGGVPAQSEIGLRIRVPLSPDTTGRAEGVSRFGVDINDPLLRRALQAGQHRVVRLHAHARDITTAAELGNLSEIMVEALTKFDQVRTINLGGGMTGLYRSPEEAARAWTVCAEKIKVINADCHIIVEPGAQLVTRHGYLGTSVVSVDQRADGRQLAVLRDSRWQLVAWSTLALVASSAAGDLIATDLVGPTCYEKDIWAAGLLMSPLQAGDRLVISGLGAYVASMFRGMHGLPMPDQIIV